MDVLSGSVLTKEGIIDGYVCIENGIVISVEEGVPPAPPLASGLVVPPLVNSHTHCADIGLKVPGEMTVEELVGPPDGLKHVYLRGLDEGSLEKNIRTYAETSRRNGIGAFIDFREGGERGCRILRKAAPEAAVLGRPVSQECDPGEISRILDAADGIGISGISDMEHRYLEKAADLTRDRGKMFAVHASERRREDIDLILSLDPAFVVHMTEATDSDLLKCAEAEVPIVVCAGSNRYFKKTPPIKRMLDCGVDVAIGTDNAMLRGPDMRSEAAVFMDVLLSQGGSVDDVTDPMLKNGRKLLYPHNKIHVSVGTAADLTVLPCSGGFRMDRVLQNRDPIFRYRPGKEGLD
ncbi:MAG: amidohydrolase family protein [Candidatus Methanoplasma sp.]|jgi:cytosine/adenosine deaminase-related metal-dependent hydrolase|nr:amidohydrolase family protein [Candidatus Methanoplasma sp.]